MKPARILVLAISLVAGLAAAMLASTSKPPEAVVRQPVPPPPVPTESVLVAANDLYRGDVLTETGPKRSADRQAHAANRRKQIAESLKELGETGKRKKQSLEARIAIGAKRSSSWLHLCRRLCLAGSSGLPERIGSLSCLPYASAGLVCQHGHLAFLRKRRLRKFVDEFPKAVDVIIRGVKAGLPLGDCLRVIATEAAEPVRSEFRHIVEAQAMGFSTGEAVERIVERVPIPEASFFSIVITIQQTAGGNLAETLGNLSSVLRDRKKMKAKIKAVSSQAKASAYIIGSLPFLVGGMVYFTSPKYMELCGRHRVDNSFWSDAQYGCA